MNLAAQNYNPYGQPSALNPYSVAGSGANVSAAQLAQLGVGNKATAGSTLNVNPVTGASLSNLGTSTPVSAAPLAALSSLGGASSAAGGVGGLGSSASATGGGLAGGLQTAGSAIGVLGNLANIYLGFKAAGLAKDQFNFQKDAYNNNLENSVQTYNTSLEDRIRARHNTESRSAAETSSYLDSNRLSANTIG